MTTTNARRLPRGTLTPELIVTESLRLLDTEGSDGFSMPKLGRALGANPTAVYRHFAGKDDLVLAIADRLIAEALDDLQPEECRLASVEQTAWQLRATYVAHPAAAVLSSYRTTQGPAESLDADLQQADRAAWSRTYRAVDRDEYPHIWSLRDELAGVQDGDIFETALSFFLEGLRLKAPTPCGCAKHATV